MPTFVGEVVVAAVVRVPTQQLSDQTLVDHVPALLAAIVARLRSRSTTVESIERDVGRGPASIVHAEDRFLARFVDNLVTNALRYSPPESSVHVEVDALDEARVALRVRNEGEPIPAEARARLFEPFKPRVDGQVGLGLGLYIAAELARAHGGELSLEYSDQRGTSFVLTLPRA